MSLTKSVFAKLEHVKIILAISIYSYIWISSNILI